MILVSFLVQRNLLKEEHKRNKIEAHFMDVELKLTLSNIKIQQSH